MVAKMKQFLKNIFKIHKIYIRWKPYTSQSWIFNDLDNTLYITTKSTKPLRVVLQPWSNARITIHFTRHNQSIKLDHHLRGPSLASYTARARTYIPPYRAHYTRRRHGAAAATNHNKARGIERKHGRLFCTHLEHSHNRASFSLAARWRGLLSGKRAISHAHVYIYIRIHIYTRGTWRKRVPGTNLAS